MMDTLILVLVVIFSLLWFVVKPLAVLIAGLRKKESPAEHLDIEGISVIIPCHNEEDLIEDTIDSVFSQDLNCDIELILIENNSTDRTLDIIRSRAAEDARIIVESIIPPKNQTPISAALNHGLKKVSYPVLVRMDADTVLARQDSIQKAITPILKGEAIATACNVRVANLKQSLITRLQSIEYFLSMEMERKSQSLYNSILCCSGGMQAFRTDAIKEVGGYHTHPWMAEDMEITLKMHKKGKIIMVTDAISYTDVPPTMKELYKQRLWWMVLGIVCMFEHKRSIGNAKVGRKGLVGLIGLPVKLFTTFQAFVGIIIKGTASVVMASDNAWYQIMIAFLIFSVFHFTLTIFMTYVVRPVASDKQGSEYWYLMPVFSLIYQPFLAVVRFIGVLKSFKVLFFPVIERFYVKTYIYTGQETESIERSIKGRVKRPAFFKKAS